jgi:hypothetical protein
MLQDDFEDEVDLQISAKIKEYFLKISRNFTVKEELEV